MSDDLLTPPSSGEDGKPFEQLVEEARQALPPLPSDPRKIMFALDVDGTIVRPDGMSPRMRLALQQAAEAGTQVTIATGRGIPSTQAIVREAQLDGRTVSSNGALVLRWEGGEYEIEKAQVFDPAPSARRFLEEVPGVLLAIEDALGRTVVSEPFPHGELTHQQVALSLDEMISGPSAKLIARAPWIDRDEFEQLVIDMALPDVSFAVGWTSWVDVGPFGVTKATSLVDLAQDLGVTTSIALGDGMNDIEMLQWATHGVAMGSATGPVLAAADAVTGAVEHDGAAAVLTAVLEQL